MILKVSNAASYKITTFQEQILLQSPDWPLAYESDGREKFASET